MQISALSSGEIDKYEYLTGEDILPSNQSRMIEQGKFRYYPLGKTFEKQKKKRLKMQLKIKEKQLKMQLEKKMYKL